MDSRNTEVNDCNCDLCVKRYGPRETVFANHPKRPEPLEEDEI